MVVSVSLYDSLDDTSGGDRNKDTGGSLDRGNTSTFAQVREMYHELGQNRQYDAVFVSIHLLYTLHTGLGF